MLMGGWALLQLHSKVSHDLKNFIITLCSYLCLVRWCRHRPASAHTHTHTYGPFLQNSFTHTMFSKVYLLEINKHVAVFLCP